MRVVVALGGNALLPRRVPLEFEIQRASARRAAKAVAPIARSHRVILTHGNGPQVGLLALQGAAYREVTTYPLHVLVAQSEGMIGYILETELDRELDGEIITLLTRTVVDADDPAFSHPTKPIGPIYEDTPQARAYADGQGWVLHTEDGGLRRVVASPDPIRIVSAELIRYLSDKGILVICAGGGGIPVVDRDGWTEGVEAVVDKDLASSLLATELNADLFVSLTDVPGVIEGWGTDKARLITRASATTIRGMDLAPGSMGPKVEAVCRFVERTGKRAAIGALVDAEAVVEGRAGTQIEPGLRH